MIRILVVLALCCVLDGYKLWQNDIPNGDRVPHPCKPNFLWEGVGHQNVEGGGERNPFGKDFGLNGLVWDECICRRDSDGDGRTNGEELGDPDCVWKPGDVPARSDDLSHPGVCEPVNSPYCAANNDWEFCDYEGFECPALKEEGVEIITLKFGKTTVPAEVTSYFCMTFDLGLDPEVEYHIIATEPVIENKNVMHHALLYGCADGLDSDTRIDTPETCGMLEQGKCSFNFGGWTVGSPGQCFPAEYGIKAGKGGIKAVLMQFHWNNPQKRSDYTDESGMRLYLTRKLRPADGATLSVGADYLKIPPGMMSLNQYGYCTANCTKYMPRTITLTSLSFHMHYLGRSAKLVHKRDGKELQAIEEKSYSYDSPIDYELKEPIEFRPGDEMTLTCGFKSTSRTNITYFGLGTSDEMCYAFINYYPQVPKLSACMSYGTFDVCYMPDVSNKYGFLGNECDFDNATIVMSMRKRLEEYCNLTCTSDCRQTLNTLHKEHPCLRGEMQRVFEHEVLAPYYGAIGRQVGEMLNRCDKDWDSELFYIRAGLIDTSKTGNNDNSNGGDKPRDTNVGNCIFDLSPDYGIEVAGAAFLAHSTILFAVTMLLTVTML